MEKKTRFFNEGTVLIIALITVTFLGAVAVAVMAPVGTASKASTTAYNYMNATLGANSAAERTKYIMCRPDAVADDAISQCVVNSGWTPINTFEENGFMDEAGVTYPTVDATDSSGNYVFDTSINDPDFPPLLSFDGTPIRYIVFTTEDGNGNAMSYVSAELNGDVVNLRVAYTRSAQFMEPPNPLFNIINQNKAVFGKNGVQLNSNAWTDSWNSELGDYPGNGQDPVNEDGDVATDGQIVLAANARIYGNAVIGPNGSVVGDISQISGDPPIETLSQEQTFPELAIPDIVMTQETLTVSGTLEIGPGDFRYSELILNNNSDMIIHGPSRIVIDVLFQAKSNTTITIVDGPVSFFGKEDSAFEMASNSSIDNPSHKPENCRIYTNGTCGFNSNTQFYGIVYAPNAIVEPGSNTDIYGGIIAQQVILRSNSQVHWDEALLEADLRDDFVMEEIPPEQQVVYTGPYEQSSFQYLE